MCFRLNHSRPQYPTELRPTPLYIFLHTIPLVCKLFDIIFFTYFLTGFFFTNPGGRGVPCMGGACLWKAPSQRAQLWVPVAADQTTFPLNISLAPGGGDAEEPPLQNLTSPRGGSKVPYSIEPRSGVRNYWETACFGLIRPDSPKTKIASSFSAQLTDQCPLCVPFSF